MCWEKNIVYIGYLNLKSGFHAPYRKPLNDPLFIHKNSNHPPNVTKEVPRNACKRLSANSSNKQIFDNNKGPTIEALKRSGFTDFELEWKSLYTSKESPITHCWKKVLKLKEFLSWKAPDKF